MLQRRDDEWSNYEQGGVLQNQGVSLCFIKETQETVYFTFYIKTAQMTSCSLCI